MITRASQTDFKTGLSVAETIAATFATYDPGPFTPSTTGVTTVVPTTTPPIALKNGTTDVVTETGVGDNTVSWTPTEAVAVPSTAVTGTYTGTLQESVA